jgi:hypothetical protein
MAMYPSYLVYHITILWKSMTPFKIMFGNVIGVLELVSFKKEVPPLGYHKEVCM